MLHPRVRRHGFILSGYHQWKSAFARCRTTEEKALQMGRPIRHSGGYKIQNAETLFRQSVEAGKPDFSYIALAIGTSPGSPPPWAILQCIELRSAMQMSTARGHPNVSGILDDIIRLLDRLQHNWWMQTGGDGSKTMRPKYKRPSLRSVIINVAKEHSAWRDFVGSADNDWMKPIREAWDWEQKYDLASDVGGELLDGFATTSRIERVVMENVAAENGDPADMAKWAWTAKMMIDLKTSDQS
jgi:hypothetical protein